MGKKHWIFLAMAALLTFWGFSSRGDRQEQALPDFSEPSATAAAMATQPAEPVEFPCVIRDTELIAEHLGQYEGPYLEAEGEEQVAGVAALMVYNPGNKSIKSAQILLTQGTDSLLFEITCLPPRSRILVLEKNRRLYSGQDVTACRCTAFSRESFGRLEEQIAITEADGQLAVENLTREDFSSVTLYYKQYAPEGDFFLGGITSCFEIGSLAAGEIKTVAPYRYAPGYSQVVAVVASNLKKQP